MKKVTIVTIGSISAAVITAVGTLVGVIVSQPSSSASNNASNDAPIAIKLPTEDTQAKSVSQDLATPRCTLLIYHGAPLQLAMAADNSDGSATCNSAHLQIGRLSAQEWWTVIYNPSNRVIPGREISVQWTLPAELTLIPGTTFKYLDSGTHAAIIESDSTVKNGQTFTGSFYPNSWIWISFMTVTNSKELPACTDRTVWIGAKLVVTSIREKANTGASLYMTDRITSC
jgi:hypothetical protein